MFEWLTSKFHISGVLVSNSTRFCSAVLSHPLYFGLFVFFLPYLLILVKFVFLSPLCIVGFILFLVLLPNENLFSNIVSSRGSAKHLLLVYNSVLEKLRPEKYYESEKFCGFEELEIYEAIFGSSEQIEVSEEKKGEDGNNYNDEKRLQSLEETKNESAKGVEIKRVAENQKAEAHVTVKKVNDISADSEDYPMIREQSMRLGSMRTDKEWKRSLACRLLDERCEEEGMDSLWETYETESNKMKAKNDGNNMKAKKKGQKQEEEEDGDDSEDDQVGGGLCCLQALKFSSVKMMNLGIGKPNSLVRFSKAAKGIGWLRNVKKKHSKKVHNNGD
ncbi:Unknown protein [Striga hermonthica]|uniref:Uncharacterized protein n=1 Tax=Striga hermonthica TaxID=68872 RepID=A0A9N7NAU1_STRHE|nr:Unknown protein [Striga hermonthica]